MILTIDIGNSNITLGGFQGDELSFVARVSTRPMKTADEYAVSILQLLALHRVERDRICGAILSSVVPALNGVMKQAVSMLFDTEPLIVGPGIKTGLNIHCDIPSSVGADLICASVAAYHCHGGPVLIVDMGTATNMILVDRRGAFVGVSICPGVLTGLDALVRGAAQLPQVSPESPGAVIAKNTADCMRSGVIYGHAAMVDGMIDRISEEAGTTLSVCATGAQAHRILPHCHHSISYDEHLVLKGLRLLYEKNSRG